MENQDYLECINCGEVTAANKMYGNLCFECAQLHNFAECESCGDIVVDPGGVPVLCDDCGYSVSLG